jgi:O-antigen/teichoic acid export membrane protein
VREIRSLLVESLPIIVAVGLIAVHTALDTVLLETFGSARDVGILGAVYAAIGPFLVVIPQAVSLAFMPEIARQASAVERRDVSIIAMLRVLVVISACCAAAGVPLLPMFVELVSSGRYSTDINVFTWFLWSAPLAAIVVFVQEVAVTLGHQRRNVAIAGVLVLATVIFGILWIPGMLSLGAVVARLSTLAVGAVYCVWLLYRFMAKPVDLWVLARIVIVVGGSMGVSYALAELPIAPIIASAGALLGTCGIAVAVGLVGANDLRHVRSLLRSETPST